MRSLTLALTAAVALLNTTAALSIPRNVKYVTHEKREGPHASHALTKRSPISPDSLLPIRIGLTQRDLHLGYDYILDVSHPESKNYGKHYTAAEVNKLFAPTAETVQAVRDWLISSGIAEHRIKVSDNKGWLAFDAAVEEAEELFRASYYQQDHHSAPNKFNIGCDEYSLPEHIRKHIDYVSPAVKHGVYKRQLSRLAKRDSPRSNFIVAPIVAPPSLPEGPDVSIDVKVVPLNCSSYVIDGDCIRALYNLPAQNNNRKVSPTNALGIFEESENYDKADLKLWIKNFAPYVPIDTIPEESNVDGGIGPVSQANGGGEALLDITIAYELIYPQVVNVFSVDDPYEAANTAGFMDTWLDAVDGSFCTYSAFGQKGDNNTIDPVYPDPHQGGYKGALMCGEYTPPKVLSVSYTDPEQYLPVNYVERQCNEWMKLALAGTTTLFASGDYGVSPYPGSFNSSSGCMVNPVTGARSVFGPSLWNGCPYILSVGATTIKANTSGYSNAPEESVYETFAGESLPYTSGGGFSNVFARPSYQDNAVANYFQNYDPGYPHYSTTKGKNIAANGGLYNRAGRAFPDVSANGAWTHIYINGTLYRYGGTSMATPLVASIINIINDQRIAAGKSTVGFVNPTFYANPQAFTDITIGANQGCGLTYAFNCTPEWDPVSGLGTPKFNMLHDIFMQLP